MQDLIHFLAHKAYNLRVSSIEESAAAGSGHLTSCLSAADIIAVLFFHSMFFDPQNFENPNADRFILSKGHASALLYAVWKELGMISAQELLSYRSFNSRLEGHPTFRFPYTEAATGSLGIGLSIGVGEALSAQIDGRNFKTYVLMGDSEIAEGSVWEAAELAQYNNLSNLVAIVDINRLGQSTPTMLEYDFATYAQRFAAFGFDPFIIDGHDIKALVTTFDTVIQEQTKPVIILAKTVKGFGLDDRENKEGYHGKAVTREEAATFTLQIRKRFTAVSDNSTSYLWQPKKPVDEKPINKHVSIKSPSVAYQRGTKVATRKAFGTALAALGGISDQIVSLDAEVKNSTYAEDFEQQYPKRFIQCFVAEQNMVSMAVGLERRGKIPFVSTFGSFFTRAHDQIRMAAIGQAALRLVGSHAGVSIGEDGPSQMALEDIALMRALPQSIVLYPSDAVSTNALVGLMANYHDGISYLRTTRMATPVLYNADTTFVIGGCTVLTQYEKATALIIGAGITLFEAIKAHDSLFSTKDIKIAIIDLYSIKPIDAKTIKEIAYKSNKCIITVEDHYQEGGISEAVRSALAQTDIRIITCAVTKLPRSGRPEELLAFSGIDAEAIIQAVINLM